jgi:hypothetical protein
MKGSVSPSELGRGTRPGQRSRRGVTRRRTRFLPGACVAVAALVVAGCSSSSSTTSAWGKLSGKVVVFAATSLTDAFDKIGA